MRWTQEEYDAYNARRAAQGAKPEPAVPVQPMAAPKGEGSNAGGAVVRITSYRVRLLDPDNLCAKYFIDGLRYAGLIPNDRPQDIELSVGQEKVATKEEERTEITIMREP